MSSDTAHPADTESIACLLSGPDQAARAHEVEELFQGVEQLRELADGYAFAFAGDDATAATLVEFITVERRCCPFFRFGLSFEPHGGPIWLELRGSEQVKAMVQASFLGR